MPMVAMAHQSDRLIRNLTSNDLSGGCWSTPVLSKQDLNRTILLGLAQWRSVTRLGLVTTRIGHWPFPLLSALQDFNPRPTRIDR